MALQLDLTEIINTAINEKMAGFNIEDQIKELLGEVAKNTSKVLEVKLQGAESGKKFPLVHKQFETLLGFASVKGINVLLTGGAGLSKSTAVEQVAEAFNLEFSQISFSNQTTKTDLIGFVDANGIYRKSGFVDAFANGKVFLADEMDACSANVLVLLNSAISNGFIETPDNKIVRVHDNFRFIATANTNLRGAKNGFSARNKLDSATIDRFAVIEWELDEDLEQKITNNDQWLEIVRACRKTAEKNLEGVVITPRSSYDGAKLLSAGLDVDTVIKATIFKAMGEDEVKILDKCITASMKKSVKVGKKVEPKVTDEAKAEDDWKRASVDDFDDFDDLEEVETAETTDNDDFEW